MKQLTIFLIAAVLVLAGGLALPHATFAQGGLLVEVAANANCDQATFMINVAGGSGTFDLVLDFGDGELQMDPAISTYPFAVEHAYPGAGQFGWAALASDSADPDLSGMAAGSLSIGPSVTLMSDIFPPLLTLESGEAALNFTADVLGGQGSLTYAWDLDGDGVADAGADPSSASASFTYTSPGKFQASVTVTDECGFSSTDTLAVVVFDSEDACHPRAQQVAEAVSSLFPDQAEQLYSCEDIFNFFTGGLTGSQLGFGRMWHAYQMALAIEELTWEEILDWHLEGNGWGHLAQLDRFAEALADVGVRDLVEMVLSGEASVQEIRTAVRAVVRYEADFHDALDRIAAGANPGELGQFYRLAQDLGVDPATLDGYLENGLSLSDLRHASSLADRYGSDLDTVAAAHASGHSWGEIGQAFKLADGEHSAEEILEMGVKAFRESQREDDRAEREAERAAREISRLAERFGLADGDVAAIVEACGGDMQCAQKALRDQAQADAQVERNQRAAAQISRQYGVSLEQVWQVFNGTCQENWTCVKRHFRELAPSGGGNGNGNGNGKKN